MPDNCNINDCPLTVRVEALEDTNKAHSKTHREIFGRLGALETHNAVQDAHYKAIDAKLDELTLLVKELTGKSGKRWDGMVDKAITVLVGAVIGYIMARLGLTG